MGNAKSSSRLNRAHHRCGRSRIVRTNSTPNLSDNPILASSASFPYINSEGSSSKRVFRNTILKRSRTVPNLLSQEKETQAIKEPYISSDDISEMDFEELLNHTSSSGSQIDFKFLLQAIINLKSYIIPITRRRILLYSLYIGLLLLFFCTDLFSYAQEAALSNITWLMVASFLVEPSYLLFMASRVDYPKVERLNTKAIIGNINNYDIDLEVSYRDTPLLPGPVPATLEYFIDQRYDNKDIGIIITCHNSEKKIIATIQGMLRHFFPNQIIISDNGSKESDRTRQIVKQISNEIIYIKREKGNKTGAQILAAFVSQFKFSLLCDDDTVVGPNFTPDIHLINDIYKGICYPIKAKGKHRDNLITRWQQIEYMISDGTRYAIRGGAIHFHGALLLIETKILRKVLKVHPSEFIAEDLVTNILLNRLKNSDGYNYQVAMSYQEPIETDAPMSFIGTPPNLAEQRIRWETGRLSHIRYFFMALFCTKPKDINNFILQKLDQIYEVYSTAGEFTKILLFSLVGHSPHFWLRFGIYVGITSIIAPYWNLQLRRSKAKGVDWFAASTYFIYRLLLYPFTFIAVSNTLFSYLPVCKVDPQFGELKDTVLDRESLLNIYKEFNKNSNDLKLHDTDRFAIDMPQQENKSTKENNDKDHIGIVIEDDFEREVNLRSLRPSDTELSSTSMPLLSMGKRKENPDIVIPSPSSLPRLPPR